MKYLGLLLILLPSASWSVDLYCGHDNHPCEEEICRLSPDVLRCDDWNDVTTARYGLGYPPGPSTAYDQWTRGNGYWNGDQNGDFFAGIGMSSTGGARHAIRIHTDSSFFAEFNFTGGPPTSSWIHAREYIKFSAGHQFRMTCGLTKKLYLNRDPNTRGRVMLGTAMLRKAGGIYNLCWNDEHTVSAQCQDEYTTSGYGTSSDGIPDCTDGTGPGNGNPIPCIPDYDYTYGSFGFDVQGHLTGDPDYFYPNNPGLGDVVVPINPNSGWHAVEIAARWASPTDNGVMLWIDGTLTMTRTNIVGWNTQPGSPNTTWFNVYEDGWNGGDPSVCSDNDAASFIDTDNLVISKSYIGPIVSAVSCP